MKLENSSTHKHPYTAIKTIEAYIDAPIPHLNRDE